MRVKNLIARSVSDEFEFTLELRSDMALLIAQFSFERVRSFKKWK